MTPLTDERLITPTVLASDETLDQSLRPRRLADYIGQQKIKQALEIFLGAARKRNEAIEHVLLHGSPGLGKTTLAHVIAFELGVNIRVTSGAALERAGDIAAILTNLADRDILFIDEIHRLPRIVEEVLYPAMEDYAIDVVLGKGPSARTLRLDLPKFTLIGATTRVSLLSNPLRDRFGVSWHLDFYEPEDIATIIARASRILKTQILTEAIPLLAARSRRTPRIANRLLKRVRDYAEVKGNGEITPVLAQAAFGLLEVDPMGLDATDRRILATIIEKYYGGPAGLAAIASAAAEETATIEEVYEPYLVQIGFLARTPRGRVVTEAGYKHLGKIPPADLQTRLI